MRKKTNTKMERRIDAVATKTKAIVRAHATASLCEMTRRIAAQIRCMPMAKCDIRLMRINADSCVEDFLRRVGHSLRLRENVARLARLIYSQLRAV